MCFVSHNSERKVKILTSEFFGGVFSPERKNSENNVGEKVILRKSRNSEKKV